MVVLVGFVCLEGAAVAAWCVCFCFLIINSWNGSVVQSSQLLCFVVLQLLSETGIFSAHTATGKKSDSAIIRQKTCKIQQN